MNMNSAAPQLEFAVEGAAPVPRSAVPQLALKLRITCAGGELIHSVLLRCQIHIDAARRRYATVEQSNLLDLFGAPRDWNRTLRSLLWTHANLSVPGFTETTLVDVPIVCTHDFNLASVKYFDSLEGGDVPLSLLFNGTVFYGSAGEPLQIGQIPWEKQAHYRLPAQLWHDLMEQYYPNSAWLRLRKDVFDQLHAYKRRNSLPTWEQAIERLLAPDEASAPVSQ